MKLLCSEMQGNEMSFLLLRQLPVHTAQRLGVRQCVMTN